MVTAPHQHTPSGAFPVHAGPRQDTSEVEGHLFWVKQNEKITVGDESRTGRLGENFLPAPNKPIKQAVAGKSAERNEDDTGEKI